MSETASPYHLKHGQNHERLIRAQAKAQQGLDRLKDAIVDVLPPPNADASELLGPTAITRKLGLPDTVFLTSRDPKGKSHNSDIVYLILEMLAAEGRAQRSEKRRSTWERTAP